MLSFDELQKKYKDQKPQTVAGPSTEDPLYIKYREAVEAEKPKVAGGTVNPIISFGNVRENPVLKRKTNTTKTYSQALTESRNKAKVLENGAKLPAVIPPKGDVSKLILPDTGGGGTVNPTFKANEYRTNYDYMTDREAAVYKYYRDRGQVEKAQEYLDALEMDVNQRAAMQKQEDAKKLAEESTAAALYARAVGNIGQAAGAAYALAMEGADKPVDPYHPLMGGVNMNEGLYEGLMGNSTGLGKFAKEAGLAVFDWGTQAAALGPLTPYVMAAGAAAGNTKEALERGGTTDEAVMYGLAGGAAEAITEKLGYDRLFELGKITKNKGAVSTFLKSLLPQAASEGAEEATSEIANILADTLIMGDNSQMKQIAQTAMENGATESEAVKTALMEGIKQVGYSGAVGAASGGVIAGGIGGLSRMTGRNTLEMAGNPVETARDAMTNAGNEVTQRTMKSRTRSEVPEGTQPETMLKEQGNVLPERENMLPEQENVMVNRENVPEVTQQNKALREFGEKYYYTEGQKVVNEEAERRGDTSFIPAFQTYYTAGLTGVKESDIKQTAETIVADKGLLRAAYLAGVNDRKEDLEARMKGTGKMGQTAGVFLETDAVTEDQLSFIKAVSKVAELEAVLVEELPEDRRGYYENNKGRITIAVNSGQFAGTVFHELSHYIREANPEGFDRMRQAVFSAAAAMKGMDTEAYIKSYEKRYGEAYREAGQEAGYDVILEEMTADMLGELAGDEKSLRAFLEELNRENPTVLGKIREFVESLLKTLKSLVNDGRFSSFSEELKKDIDFTERLAKMLAEETKKAGEMQRGENAGKGKGKDTEKKLSKKIGGVFPEINVSVEDFKQMGISEKSLNNLKVIEEKVYQYLSGKFLSEGNREKPILNLDTGMEVCVYRGGINETFRKDAYYKNLSSEWKKIKLAAMMHMDMLIKYGEIREKEAANYHNENSTTRFAYLTAPILVGGKPYTVDIDIKRTDRGDRFHVHKIKIADSSAQAAKMRPVFEVELSAEQIIAQDNREDNGKGGESGKRFSFAGERARTADREKLDMAKKMEEEGKTPERIYEETGWFRGLDQKWKFEIDDSAAEFFPEGDANLQNNPSYKKFREMMENGETDKPEFWSLWEIFEGEMGKEDKSLNFYLKHEKLFEQYPILQYVKIRIEDMRGKNREGYYDPAKNEIVLDGSLLNQYTKEKTKGIMLHEIQHAIQKYEGFTQGSNTKVWEDVRTEIKEILAGAVRNRDLWLADIGYNDFVKKSMMQVAKKEKTMQEHWEDVKKFKENSEFAKQIEAAEKEVKYYEKHLAMVSNLADGTWANANEMYWNTAGEIEARAVEERKDLTEKERRKEKVNLNREKAVFAENLNEMAKRYGVRFSLKEPVEETKDLIAVHNMNAEDLKRTLQLGGMPMPSIAVVKGKIGHENFGEISLVFGKDTIDPEGMKENRVYGADAWTPTVPQIDYEVDSKKAKAFENEVGERASRFADGIFSSYSVLRSIGVDESTRKTENEVVKELAGQDAVIAAYLEEQGKAMEPVYDYKEKSYDRHGNDALRAYIQKKGTDELRKLVQDMESGAVDWMEAVQGEMDRYRESIEPELRKRAQGFFKSRPAEVVEKKVTERLKKEMVPNRVREFIEHAWELQSNPVETEGQVDRNATREKMRKMVDAEAVEKWVKEKTKGMLGEAGIYNGKDPYTQSGKQRTFAQMHYAYTLENLVKAMKGNQQEKGEGLWGATARGLQAVTSREYRSIAQIRGDKGRLQQVDEGEYKAELEAIDREIESIVSEIKKTNKAHSDNTYTESDIIGAVMLEAAQGRHTKAAIKKAFANNDYDISDMVAGKMANVFESVMELPTTYFEAKPQRAVMVDEIRAAIVPDDLGADVVEQMEKAGVPVLTYEAGNEKSRKEALNSVEGVRFSIREEEYDALVEENEALKEANKALRRQFEITKDAVHDPVSAKKAVRKWLKAHDSEYDVDDFTEKFVALADYVANAGDRVDFQQVMGALQKLAYDALSESKVLNTDLSDVYKDFKEDVRKTKIKVTEDMAEEFDYYGGYNSVRKENFGKINLSRQGGIYADVFYQEMAEKYPELLDVERVSTQVDVVMDLMDVVDSLQPIYENPYGMNLDEYAMDAAYDLWEMYFDIELQKPTFADKYEKKLEKEKARARAARENLRKDLKERYDEKLQQAKEDQKKKLEDARLAAAMHEGRALLEQRRAIYEKLKARDKERRDRAEYAKYKNIIEKEAALLKRWVERPTDQYHVQESMMEGVRNFLEKMKFDDPDLNIMPTDIHRMMDDYKAMTDENTMLYAEEDENVNELLKSLDKRVGNGIKVSELGPTEMRQLSVVIRSVSHLVRNANKMVSIKNGQKISAIGDAYMEDVENKKTKNPDSRLRVLNDMMNVQMLDTESFFREMGETVHDTIYRGLREGFDRKIIHVKEASEFMQKTVDKKKIREWGEMEPKEYTLSGGKISLTDAQIMSLYCLMRRTQARGHIFGGGIKGEPVVHKVRGEKGKREIVKNTKPVKVTAADVTKLMSNLTEEQKKAALEIQGYLESVASWGNEVTMNMLGYKKFTETNYFPIVTDENYINTMYGARGEKNSTLKTMGITKQTNREAKNPIILENIFDAYVRHIDQMSSYNAFVPALSDLNKFMNYREMVRVVDGKKFGENRSVKETMQRVMGPAGQRYISDLADRLNNPAVKEDVERLPRIFLRNMKIASVGANLRVIIQQPVSYLRAADEIGVGYLMGALVPSKTDFEKVYEYAPIAQWKEWGNYEMNVGRTMKELLIGQNFYESFLEKSMIAAGIMDKLTWGRIWRAAELEVKKKHPELTGNRYYETVGKRFSEIIDGTQVVDSILHRNQMMRSQSLLSQMETSFMSEPTKTYNMMRNSMVAVIKDNTPENRKKVVRTFMTLVANGVCVAAAAGLVDMLRDDDDDETLLEKWLQAFRGDFSEAESVSDYILAAIGSNLGNSFNPLGYIPYMRDIFSVIQGYTVQRTDISWLNDLVKSGKNLMRYMSGESNYTLNAVLMDAAGSLSKATGIPINSAKRDILAIKNTIVNYTLGLDAQYENQKMTYDVGSEKNISMYVKMMLEAKMSGNEQIATRIYNDMVNGGISNEKIDNKIKTEQVKAIKEEPEAMEAAKAYNEGRVDDYTRNVEALAKKGYFMANIESAVESLTKPPTEDEETFETITKDYWKEEGEVESADYALLFNAYMNGNMADYDKMWAILNAAGKEDNSIRSSMRSRLKSEYWKAKEAGDSQRMQRAAEEFYRLGGKRETLEKAPQ
nr:MAG TPA: nuclease [Caudoviricetes sp.]